MAVAPPGQHQLMLRWGLVDGEPHGKGGVMALVEIGPFFLGGRRIKLVA